MRSNNLSVTFVRDQRSVKLLVVPSACYVIMLLHSVVYLRMQGMPFLVDPSAGYQR
jgi:hypothetical protein